MSPYSVNELIFDEKQIPVNKWVALAFGMEEAIILQEVYFLTKSKNIKNQRRFSENKEWIGKSVAEWVDHLPFLSEKTFRRKVEKLEAMGVLFTSFLNEDKRNRTLYYSVDVEKIKIIASHARDRHFESLSKKSNEV